MLFTNSFQYGMVLEAETLRYCLMNCLILIRVYVLAELSAYQAQYNYSHKLLASNPIRVCDAADGVWRRLFLQLLGISRGRRRNARG